MSFTPLFKLENEIDIMICNICTKISNSYNTATKQNLTFEISKDYFIYERSSSPDILKLLWNFNFKVINVVCEKYDETVLSHYILDLLKSRLEEIYGLDKNDENYKIYVRTFYRLLSNFNFDFLSHNDNILDSNNSLNNLKSQFDNLYKSWL
jgi:hypothetical protein